MLLNISIDLRLRNLLTFRIVMVGWKQIESDLTIMK